LPFRQPHSRTPPPLAAAPIALTLRREEVVLFASPQVEVSPATNLETIASDPRHRQAPQQADAPQPARRTFELTNLAPPPPLPIAFQPVTASEPPAASDWRPISRQPPAPPRSAAPLEAARRPRTYRLRDGDTLENVAERYLGSAARAMEIFEANREVLARPDLLPVGKTITIPPKLPADDLQPIVRER
jgi:nucleoid-associated protein YgaU